MTDWGMSGRRDEYHAVLVDPFTLAESNRELSMVAGESSITWSLESDNLVTASISQTDYREANQLIRVKHDVTLPDGTSYRETLGTFFVDGSDATGLYGAVNRTCSCYSTLWRHTQDTLIRDFCGYAGDNVVDEMERLVAADGGRMRALPGVDTSRTHTKDIWFQPGTNKAEALRTIAGWINCEVGVDADGYITVAPYAAASDRAVSYTFEAGSNCVYLPGINTSDTRADSVNRVRAYFSRDKKPQHALKDADGNYVKGDDGNTVYVDDDPYPVSDFAVADLPPTHPFSYERLGRRKTYSLELEPCPHEEVEAQAQRYLEEHKGAVDEYVVEHVGIPGLKIGDVVRYMNPNDGNWAVDDLCQVIEIAMSLKPGAPCKTKLRAI